MIRTIESTAESALGEVAYKQTLFAEMAATATENRQTKRKRPKLTRYKENRL